MPERPGVGTPVRVAVAPGCGDPWPGTVVPTGRSIDLSGRVNVMAHGSGSIRTVRLDQLLDLEPDEVVLEQARAILARHGHGIAATCTDACRPTPPPFPPPCPRCSATRWVSVSLDGGHSRRAQCVPCGYVHPMPLPGTATR